VTAAVAGSTDEAGRFSGVVGVVTRKGDQISRCTGVLVAPKLMLTARHCVAYYEASDVVCGEAPLLASVTAEDVLVTAQPTQTDTPSDYVNGVEIIAAPGGDDTCGFDLAAIRLADAPPGAGSVYPPRLEGDVSPGEAFTSVGYGSDGNAGVGTRRYLEGARVACSGESCQSEHVQPNEWQGEDGAFCEHDSGAAAIDAEGRLLGTVSRGRGPCTTPILAAMPPWKDWLIDVALSASGTTGDPVPPWAMPTIELPDDMPPSTPAESEPKLASTCSFSVPRSGSAAWLLLAGCLAGLCGRRRVLSRGVALRSTRQPVWHSNPGF
jgi:hypothetical protein